MAVSVLMMPTLHVGQSTHVGALSVFPVWTDAPIVSGLDTGRAAHVQVTEREESPVVGELVLKNQGAKPALLVAGELFEGGWQHRALNHDILLMAGQQLVASVSCVESGRWHGATAQVRRSRRASMMVRSAQTVAESDHRQGQVWERVSRYDNAFYASPSCSHHRPAFAGTYPGCSRPPRSTRPCCRPRRRQVAGLAASSGLSRVCLWSISWAPAPEPGTPWPPGPPATRYVDSAGTMSYCMRPRSTVVTT